MPSTLESLRDAFPTLGFEAPADGVTASVFARPTEHAARSRPTPKS